MSRIVCSSSDPRVLSFLRLIGVDTENCTHFLIEGGVGTALSVTETRRAKLSDQTIEKPRLVPAASA